MTRRSVLSTLIALFVMTATMLVAAGGSASAQQNPNCCTYKVDIAVPVACLPFRLTTQWDCGGGPFAFIKTYSLNGIFTEPLNPGGVPPCPPACKFLGAGLNGPGGPFATFNNPVRFNINGCCMVVRIGFDINGCLIIYVRPC